MFLFEPADSSTDIQQFRQVFFPQGPTQNQRHGGAAFVELSGFCGFLRSRLSRQAATRCAADRSSTPEKRMAA